MKEFKPIKEGKVREVYDNGDSLIIAATDRISAFDVILKNEVKDKGAILTQMSKFWFDFKLCDTWTNMNLYKLSLHTKFM